MKIYGIRILDKDKHVVSVRLVDILVFIELGGLFYWMITFSDVMPSRGNEDFIMEMEKQITPLRGCPINWKDLKLLSDKIYQEIDLTIVGCKNKRFLYKYSTDQEMHEMCDISIEMIDSSYWQVFSKDEDLINRLTSKFKEVKFLTPDFEK